MFNYIVKRLLILIPLLFLLSVVVFVIIQLPPGDFLTTYISKLQSTGMVVNEEYIQALKIRYGLDEPLYVQYFKWFSELLQGNLGYSFVYNRSVNVLLGARLVTTVTLSIVSLVCIWIVAFPLGFYSATHKYSIADHTFTAVSFFGVSVPEFLLAIGIMYLYFQSTGQYAGGLFSDQFANEPWSLAKFHDMLQHVWIPLLVIVVTGTAGLFKTFRANLLDELSKPYVKTAQAKGVPYLRLLVKYPVRIALIPFISTFALFGAGRAYEQIRNSIAYVNANVKFGFSHSGLCVGEDGGSHQSIEDIALMRVMPNMTIFVPCDAVEVRKAVRAAAAIEGPVYIRVARPVCECFTDESTPFVPGKANIMREGGDVAIIAMGLMVAEALKAADLLAAEGIRATVVNMHTVKPLDEDAVLSVAEKCGAVVTAEEHSVIGGLGSAVAEVLAGRSGAKFARVGIEDRFGQSGTPAELFADYGLTAENIAENARRLVK